MEPLTPFLSPSRATGYSVHLAKNQDEEKERRKGMDNERNSGTNPRNSKELKKQEKGQKLTRQMDWIESLVV